MQPEQIARWIGQQRFQRYLDARDGQHERAVALYIWNARISAAFLEVLCHFEVLFRNAIDRQFPASAPKAPLSVLDPETWLCDPTILTPESREKVNDAIARLQSERKCPTRGRVVASLPLGFWQALFSGVYEDLWRSTLFRAFPNGDGSRREIANLAGSILHFRNRIAHHEAIYFSNLTARYDQILKRQEPSMGKLLATSRVSLPWKPCCAGGREADFSYAQVRGQGRERTNAARVTVAAMLYFSHPACLEHDPRQGLPGHPEQPERLRAIEAALAARDWLGWERRVAPAASVEELELVHPRAHVERIRDLCAAGGGAIDADTFAGEASWEAALRSAGAACAMTRALLAGEAKAGFAAGRPPGHHAEPERAMGFCLFDNVAVAAALALSELGLERVFILDWDVHHGNGTAEIFRRRADVLFASIHQGGIFPGTGAREDTGSGPGEGYTINRPVPAGSDESTWLPLLEDELLPAAAAFEPQLVLISAGFDAHRDDPLAECRLEAASFGRMTETVREAAEGWGAPVGAVLEGGYDLDALADSVVATMAAFGDEDRR